MTYRDVVRFLRALPRLRAPAGFARRVMAAIESGLLLPRAVPNPFRAALAAAAALALCAGAALWLSAPPARTPPPAPVAGADADSLAVLETKDAENARGAAAGPSVAVTTDGKQRLVERRVREEPKAAPQAPPAGNALARFGSPAPAAPASLPVASGPPGTGSGTTARHPAWNAGADPRPTWTLQAPKGLAGRTARTTEALSSIAKARGGAVDRARGAYLAEIPPRALAAFRRNLAERGFVFADEPEDPGGAPPAGGAEAAAGGGDSEEPVRLRIRVER